MTPDEEKVLDANQGFYSAVQNLSLEEMDSVWLQEDWVQCVHPGWNMLEGWEAIRESWQHIFENTRYMRIAVGLQFLRVDDTLAWVCCTEKISTAGDGRFDTAYVQTTNIFKRHEGAWYLVHHHASHLPRPWGDAEQGERVQ
ncbi:MAG: nuclear transport factor 2 family protein [Acidobacteria bacterium]|nr:nuclear transport factor 2 family protein [Acidobacteriota bacterium]